MSFFSGLSRPLRAAGVALIGVAVIAAIVGGVTALSSGGTSENTAGPSSSSNSPSAAQPAPGSSSAPATSSSSAASSAPSSAPSSPSGPAPGQQSGQPGQSAQPGPPAGQPGGDQQASNRWVTLRVYNNSLVPHLAEQAASDFRSAGWNVAEVGNYPQGVVPHTTAYYRPGTDEEAAAKQLATEFGFAAEPRFEGIENSSPGVIVIITKDYQSGHKGS